MQLIFGDNPDAPITSTITGITRQWDTFSEGIDEVIDARVYSGIHFRTADEVGANKEGRLATLSLRTRSGPVRKARANVSQKLCKSIIQDGPGVQHIALN